MDKNQKTGAFPFGCCHSHLSWLFCLHESEIDQSRSSLQREMLFERCSPALQVPAAQEKISAALKVGIPLLGTIGTYFYSAAKAFSGITNVAFSLGTGFILNRIGDSINNYYQKRFVENKTVKEIVKDTYEDVTKT